MKRSSYLFLLLLLTTSAIALTTAADLKDSPVGGHSGGAASSPKGKKKAALAKTKTASPTKTTPANPKAKEPKVLPEVDFSEQSFKDAAKFYANKKVNFPEEISQEGHFGVAPTTVTVENINNEPSLKSLEGHPLMVILIQPDGDCCFSAMGRTREEVVNALKSLIEEKQTAYLEAKKSKSILDVDLQGYEAFLVALQKECSGADADETAFQKAKEKESKKESKKASQKKPSKKAADKKEAPEAKELDKEVFELTDNKTTIQEAISNLFDAEKSGAWMPAGLLPAIAEKLDLKLVIWQVTREMEDKLSKKKSIKEFVSVAQAIRAEPDDMIRVRHILFLSEKKGKNARAAHFVILAPSDITKFAPTKKFEPTK